MSSTSTKHIIIVELSDNRKIATIEVTMGDGSTADERDAAAYSQMYHVLGKRGITHSEGYTWGWASSFDLFSYGELVVLLDQYGLLADPGDLTPLEDAMVRFMALMDDRHQQLTCLHNYVVTAWEQRV